MTSNEKRPTQVDAYSYLIGRKVGYRRAGADVVSRVTEIHEDQGAPWATLDNGDALCLMDYLIVDGPR